MNTRKKYEMEKLRAEVDALALGCMLFVLFSCGFVLILVLVLMP